MYDHLKTWHDQAGQLLTADGREFGPSDYSLAGRRVPPRRSSKVAQESLSTLEIQVMVIVATNGRAICKTAVYFRYNLLSIL